MKEITIVYQIEDENHWEVFTCSVEAIIYVNDGNRVDTYIDKYPEINIGSDDKIDHRYLTKTDLIKAERVKRRLNRKKKEHEERKQRIEKKNIAADTQSEYSLNKTIDWAFEDSSIYFGIDLASGDSSTDNKKRK